MIELSQNSVKSNFFYNSCYQILLILVPLITTPYISRVLGPEGVGIYSYSYSVAYYFTIFILLGLNNYGNRTIASCLSREEVSRNFSNIYVTQFLLGLLVIIVYIVYCFVGARDFIASMILGLYVVSGLLDVNWYFFGTQQFKISVLRNTVVKICGVLAIFLFIHTSEDVYVYCLIMAVSFFVSQVLLWPFLIKQVVLIKPSFKESKKHLKPNFVLFMTVLAVSLFKIMDKIMLGLMSNYTQVGFYESSEKIINIPVAFITALGTVMLPHATKMVSEGKGDNKEVIYLSQIFAMTLTAAFSFGIMGVADLFVPIFYGEGFEPCVVLFMILMPSCFFFAFANVIRTQYLLPHNMDKAYVISGFLGAGANLIINALLIPYFAALGAAIGTLCAEAVVCFYQCYVCRKQLNLKLMIKQAVPMVCSGLVMLFVLRNTQLNFVSPIVTLLVKIALGGIVYIVSLVGIVFLMRSYFAETISYILKMLKKQRLIAE